MKSTMPVTGLDNVLFDLDGTLTDPGEGITNSVMYALSKFGIVIDDRTRLYGFIGPPLTDSFRGYFGFTEDEAVKAVEYYREYFSDRGIFENRLYPDTVRMLSALREKGKNIVLATSKPKVFAARILAHFKLDRYFSYVAGSCLDGSMIDKKDVINDALSHIAGDGYDLRAVRDTSVMVGDREHDIIGAKAAKIASVGVLYGYGSRVELEKAGADFIAESMDDVIKTVFSYIS